MTTCVISFWRVHVTSSATTLLTMRFPIEIMFVKIFKGHIMYDKYNLRPVAISYEIYESRHISYELTTRGRFSK